MRQYLYLLLVFLVACAEYAGSKPSSSSSSAAPYKSGDAAQPATAAAPPQTTTAAAPPQTTAAAAPPQTTAAAAPPGKRDKLENSPLVWKPTTKVASLGVVDISGLSNVKLQVPKVADGRQNPTLLGENKEKGAPRIITTSDDVPAFVTEHMKQLISGAGINVADAGATHILKAELKQFYVEEIDTYKGDARLVVTLTNASGKELWAGTTGGSATRFGRSYRADNYYETLSDSLLEAIYNLLKNPTFHEALTKQ